tara:strand:- start:73 stop:240 length:168 start_codon:yes stop_codon:yes gene_type:complete
MKVGDLISYRGAPHLVVEIRSSIPLARAGQEVVVMLDTTQLETRTVPVRWIRNSK